MLRFDPKLVYNILMITSAHKICNVCKEPMRLRYRILVKHPTCIRSEKNKAHFECAAAAGLVKEIPDGRFISYVEETEIQQNNTPPRSQ